MVSARRRGTGSHSERSQSPKLYNAHLSDWEVQGDFRLCSFISFICVFAIYVLSVNPTIVGGDNPEVMTAAVQLGTAHPPGYPLITLVGHVFSRLFGFTGNPALVLNVLSALFACVASFFLSGTVYYLTNGDAIASVVSSLILSFGSTFWIQSVQFEVFTMNNMFICIVLFLTVQFYYCYWKEDNDKLFPIALKGAFVAALSLCNQHTIVFYLIPIILSIFLLLITSHELSFTRFLLLVAAFLVGCSPYLYLVIASFTPRKGNWGDMTTWTGFLHHVLRKDYGTFQLFSGEDHAQRGEMFFWGIISFFKGAAENVLVVGLPLAAFGVWRSVFATREASQRKDEKKVFDRRWVYWLLLFCFLFYVVIFHYLANLPISKEAIFVGVQLRFWMQGFIIIAIFLGVGFHALSTSLHLPHILSLLVAGLLILLQLGVNYSSVIPITRDNSYLMDYGRAQLEPLPSSSLYIVQGDLQENSILYLQQCLHVREDIDVVYLPYASYMWYNHSQISLYPKVHWPGVVYHPLGSILHDHTGNAFNLTEFLDANIDDRRIFVTSWVSGKDEPTDKYMLFPIGLYNEVKPVHTIPTEEWAEEATQALQLFVMDRDFSEGTWEHSMFVEMEESQLRYAEFLLHNIDKMELNDYQKRKYLRVAENYCVDMLQKGFITPAMESQIYISYRIPYELLHFTFISA